MQPKQPYPDQMNSNADPSDSPLSPQQPPEQPLPNPSTDPGPTDDSLNPLQNASPTPSTPVNPTVFSPNGFSPNQPELSQPILSTAQPQAINPAPSHVPPAGPALSAAAPTENQHQPPAGVVTGSFSGSNETKPFKKPKNRKKLFVGIAASAMLAILAGGFVFGYYLPNQPENVWKTGLNRTADEMDAFIEKISDPKTIETLAKNKLTITGNMDTKDTDLSLNVDSKFDDKSSDSTLSFEAESEDSSQNIKLDAAFKSQTVEGSLWPNIYFKLSGVSSLGLDFFLPGVSEFDGKWIAVEQDFYEEFLSGIAESEEGDEITREDAISLLTDISAVTRDYVFTTDENKAVLDMQEFSGTEESEGIKANRYKVKINETNATAYCKALVDKLFANESFRKIEKVTDTNREEKIEEEKESCEPAEEDEETYGPQYHEVFDIWIDKKYKLFHKVRVSEDLDKKSERYKKDKAECLENYAGFDFEGADDFCDYYDDFIETGEKYTEIGQVYKGEDEIRLFMYGKSDTNQHKDTIRADISVQLEGLLFNGKVSYQNNSEDNKSFAEFTIATEPYDGEIDSAKPDGATSIKDAYQHIMDTAQRQNGQSLGASTDEVEVQDNGSPTILDMLQSLFR